MPGIAAWKYVAAVLGQDAPSNRLRGTQNAAMRDCTAKRRTQANDGSYICGSLRRDRAGDDSSQTMANEVELAARFGERLLNGLIQLTPD